MHYGDSGTDNCSCVAKCPPITGDYSALKEEERKEKESKKPVLSAELLVYVVKMNRQTFFFFEYMHVVKCTASSTNCLTGCISVDVVIKINCINFIGKNDVLRKNL